MQDLSDDALLALIATDDRNAFRELMRRHIHKIWRVAYRVLHNEQDSEDVAQEVFVTIWNKRADWQAGEATFSTWLYRVAMNRAIDFQRRRKAPTVELSEEIAESGDIAADDFVSNQQTQAMLLSCLKQLPEKQMQAMLYYYYEEMDIEAICQKLNATEDSVRSLLKRARVGMKDMVSQQQAPKGIAHTRMIEALR